MENKRISAQNDLMFKKVLASEENIDILRGFINDFFGFEPKEITLTNPYSIAAYTEMLNGERVNILRQTLKDVTASLKTSAFTAELQVKKTKYFDERSILYPLQLYCDGYNAQERLHPTKDTPNRYSSLRPVYGFNILGYTHFGEDNDALRIFEFYDPKRNKRLGKELLKIGYFELTKSNIETENQRYWRDYFMKGEVSDSAPEYIQKASGILEYTNLNEEEKSMITLLEKAQAYHDADISDAYSDGMEIGIESGKISLITKILSKKDDFFEEVQEMMITKKPDEETLAQWTIDAVMSKNVAEFMDKSGL